MPKCVVYVGNIRSHVCVCVVLGARVSHHPMSIIREYCLCCRVLLSEYFIRNRTEPLHVQFSVALVVCGAIIAGWETIIGVRKGLLYRSGLVVLKVDFCRAMLLDSCTQCLITYLQRGPTRSQSPLPINLIAMGKIAVVEGV